MIIHPNIDPIAISIGPLSIHWYGLMYLFGFTAGVLLGIYRANKANSGWRAEEVVDLVFYIALGVILGGRLGYVVFYNLSWYLQHPLEVFFVWDGGMSFHGGLIGLICAVWYFARLTNRGFFQVGDFLSPLCLPGLGFGRIGNFLNQELWGRVSDVPWAVMFQASPGAARHPSQLYEAFLEGFLLFLIVWIYSAKPRLAGRVTGLTIAGYGVFRIVVEFFREPDAHIGYLSWDWLTMGQILSVPMVIIGMYFLFRDSSQNAVKSVPKQPTGVDK